MEFDFEGISDWMSVSSGRVSRDVETLQKLISSSGSADSFVSLFGCMSDARIQSIRAEYEKSVGSSLSADVSSRVDSSVGSSLRSLILSSAEFDAGEMWDVLQDGGRKAKSFVIHMLSSRSDQEIQAMATLFEKISGKSFGEAARRSSVKAAYGELVSRIVAVAQSGSETPVDDAEVSAMAVKIRDGVVSESELLDAISRPSSRIFFGRLLRECQRLMNLPCKLPFEVSSQLEEVLAKVTTHWSLEFVIAWMSPSDHFCRCVFKAARELRGDMKYFVRLFCHRRVDLLEAAKPLYAVKFERSLMGEIIQGVRGDLRRLLLRLCASSKEELSAVVFMEAAEGDGRRPADIGSVLIGLRHSESRAKMSLIVSRDFGKDEKELIKNCVPKGPLREFLHALSSDSAVFHAKQLMKALDGSPTNTDAAFDIIANCYDISIVSTAISRLFPGKSLLGAVQKALSGSLQTLVVNIVSGRRRKTADPDFNPSSAARRLHSAGDSTIGTDVDAFVDIFSMASKQELRDVDAAYATLFHSPLRAEVKKAMKGTIRRCILALLNPTEFSAKCLHRALARVLPERTIIRVFAWRDPSEAAAVWETFESKYGTPLIDGIEKAADEGLKPVSEMLTRLMSLH